MKYTQANTYNSNYTEQCTTPSLFPQLPSVTRHLKSPTQELWFRFLHFYKCIRTLQWNIIRSLN